MKVLIVEDDDSMVTVLKHFLEPISTEIIIATNMQHALRALQEAREIELVTLDLGLPDSSVSETLTAKIREIRRTRPNVLLVVVTGVEMPNLEKIAVENGADGVIFKQGDDFTPRGFLQLIGSIAKDHIIKPQDFRNSLSVLEDVVSRLKEYAESATLKDIPRIIQCGAF